MGYNKTIGGNLHFVDDSSRYKLLTDDYTVKNSDSGMILGIATDAKTITLPLIASGNIGMIIEIVNTGADGNNIVTISPNALDGISGNLSSSVGANADATTANGLVAQGSGVVNKNFVNTKATANKGDRVRLLAAAATSWIIMGGVGIWASEG